MKGDKFDFMSIVDDAFKECQSAEELELRKEQMIELITNMSITEIGFRNIIGWE